MAKANKFTDNLRASIMAAVSAPDVQANMQDAQRAPESIPDPPERPALPVPDAVDQLPEPTSTKPTRKALVSAKVTKHHEPETSRLVLAPEHVQPVQATDETKPLDQDEPQKLGTQSWIPKTEVDTQNGIPKEDLDIQGGIPKPNMDTQSWVSKVGYPQSSESAVGYPNMDTQIRITKRPVVGMTAHRILAYFASLNHPGYPFTTNIMEASRTLGVPEPTARKAYRRLVDIGIVERYVDAATKAPHNHICLRLIPARFQECGVDIEVLQGVQSWIPKYGYPNMDNQNTGYPKLDTQNTPLDRQIKNNFYLSEDVNAKRLLDLTADRIRDNWPNLGKIGFGVTQVRQIVANLEAVGKPLDYVLESLDYADWFVRPGQGQSLDAQGQPIKNQLDYVFSSLFRNGTFKCPADYVSPQALADADRSENIRRNEEARKERLELEFKEWLEGLTTEQKEELRRTRPLGPEEVVYRLEWCKQKGIV